MVAVASGSLRAVAVAQGTVEAILGERRESRAAVLSQVGAPLSRTSE
jgi:hypothetical protein